MNNALREGCGMPVCANTTKTVPFVDFGLGWLLLRRSGNGSGGLIAALS